MFGRRNDSQVVEDHESAGRHRSGGVVVEHHEPERAQEIRRERFGGVNVGAAFFGWLVAVAVSVLLTGIVGAVVAAIGSTASITQDEAQRRAGTIGLVAAIVLLAVLMIGYYAGGYVAGRMSRFSGTAQGLGVWVIGLLVTVLMLTLGAAFGEQYDVLTRTNLPRLPVSSGALGTTGVIAALIVLVGTLVAALLGGSVGTHYHRRVDRAGLAR
jgi:hypothetical protein